MSYKVVNKSLSAPFLLLMAAFGAAVFACGWPGTSHSVRFNEYQTERAMTRLPPLPTLAHGTNHLRVIWDMEGGESAGDELELCDEISEETDEVWNRAEVAEEEGKLDIDRELLRDYLERTKIKRHAWYEPMSRQHRRNSAIDRLDALASLDHGSTASRVQEYLNARRLQDESRSAAEIERALSEVNVDGNLKDNVAYLKAAVLYRKKELEEAARAFAAIPRRYPGSEKREAALFMAAVSTMKTSTAYTPTSGDEAHLHEYGSEPGKVHAVVIDRAWHAALAGFKRLLAEYPHGLYFNDARGWIGYLHLRNNDRTNALVEYYRLLGNKNEEDARIEAAFSLTLVRHHATGDEMARVEKVLVSEPDAALAYAYHNLYNYSIDVEPRYPLYESVKDSNGNYDYAASQRLADAREEEWEQDLAVIEHDERTRILAFSRRLMERYPNLSIGGSFALRAAQASLELDDNNAAVQFVQRALQSRLNRDEREQALWTFAMAEQRLHHFDSARKNLNTLLRDYPKSRLTENVRRTLAMIAEDEGDIDGALEQYVALKYGLDVAYFVDVLMTTEQLESFIQRHPDSPLHNELTYALGLRYLRASRWNDARATFTRVRIAPNPDYDNYSSDCNYINPTNCVDPKEPKYDAALDHVMITPRLIMRDVQTANVLEMMEQAVNQAAGDEEKAEALYQLASYQYEASDLLFYNPVAWGNNRYWNLSQLAGEGKYRAANEQQILFGYMQEHDTVARALKIYLDVVKRFPRTRAARDALYTAAVCHERLGQYNPYWRGIYAAGLHAGPRMVTYADVKAAYPGYQLPRGTFGWEPSTRTVNGAAGWAPPPKRIPPPTKTQRVKLLFESFINPLVLFWNEKGRRWLTLAVILVAIGFTVPIAKRNRKRLRPKLARLRVQTARCSPERAELEICDQLKQFLLDRGVEFWELARDARSRPILLRNIVSHTFLAGLLVSLFWNLHFG